MKNITKFALGGALGFGQIVTCLASTVLVVGTGDDFSRVTFETPNLGVREYNVFYDFDPSILLGTADLLRIINTEDSFVMIDIMNSPLDNGDPNEFPLTVTFNGVIETNEPIGEDFFFFEQFVAGGQAGVLFDPVTYTVSPNPQPISQNSFQGGPGSSAPFRIIEPGSTDVFVFGPGNGQPTVSPIPEPSSFFLLVFGGASLCFRRKKRS